MTSKETHRSSLLPNFLPQPESIEIATNPFPEFPSSQKNLHSDLLSVIKDQEIEDLARETGILNELTSTPNIPLRNSYVGTQTSYLSNITHPLTLSNSKDKNISNNNNNFIPLNSTYNSNFNEESTLLKKRKNESPTTPLKSTPQQLEETPSRSHQRMIPLPSLPLSITSPSSKIISEKSSTISKNLNNNNDNINNNNNNNNNKKTNNSRNPNSDKNRGLRFFAVKVLQIVEKKKQTNYAEVAQLLIDEISSEYTNFQNSDEQNLKRRVYDALNVLAALNIIKKLKPKKDIKWVGYPSSLRPDTTKRISDKIKMEAKVKAKRETYQDLEKQRQAFQNLYIRNTTDPNYASVEPKIGLPFIIVSTKNDTVIQLQVSDERMKYFFDFNAPFGLHDYSTILPTLPLPDSSSLFEITKEELEKDQKDLDTSILQKDNQEILKSSQQIPNQSNPLQPENSLKNASQQNLLNQSSNSSSNPQNQYQQSSFLQNSHSQIFIEDSQNQNFLPNSSSNSQSQFMNFEDIHRNDLQNQE